MPKLIVYVKADIWKKVEAGYGLDAPALMRNLAVEAIEEFLNGTDQSGVAVGDQAVSGSAADISEEEGAASVVATPRPERAAPDEHFKPDFGKKLK